MKALQQEPTRDPPKLLNQLTIEEHTELVASRAVIFTATMHLGQFNRRSERFVYPVLAAAQARIFEIERPDRRSLVYAVMATGMSSLLPRRVWEEALERSLEAVRNGMDHVLASKMPLDLSLIHAGDRKKFET